MNVFESDWLVFKITYIIAKRDTQMWFRYKIKNMLNENKQTLQNKTKRKKTKEPR